MHEPSSVDDDADAVAGNPSQSEQRERRLVTAAVWQTILFSCPLQTCFSLGLSHPHRIIRPLLNLGAYGNNRDDSLLEFCRGPNRTSAAKLRRDRERSL